MSKLERLQRAARELAQEDLPGGAEARLHARMTQPRPSRVPFALGLSLVGAAVVVVALVMWPGGASDGFVATARCEGAKVESTSVTAGSAGCEVEVARATIALSQGATVKRTPTGVRVTQGRARFHVEPRHADEQPFDVQVSQGVIRVIGTRFTVDEQGQTGRVQLEEGRISFTREGGSLITLSAGESLDWPAAEPVPPSTPNIPAPPRVPLPEPAAPPARVAPKAPEDDLFERLESLRTQGRYREAVTMLRDALGSKQPAKVKRRLSYELGSLLTHQLRDREAACTHWAAHLKAYPDDDGAAGARLALACGD